jgi:hypothetical protein
MALLLCDSSKNRKTPMNHMQGSQYFFFHAWTRAKGRSMLHGRKLKKSLWK